MKRCSTAAAITISEIRYLREIKPSPATTERMIRTAPGTGMLHFCYEAGATGSGRCLVESDLWVGT